MTLFRPFMAWGTDSNSKPSQTFKSLRWLLLLSYLTAMAGIFGTSAVAVSIFFKRSLDQQLNNRLLTLAQAAVHKLETAVPSLSTLDTKRLESLDKDLLPWRSLFRRDQSLEWFDANGKPLAKEGTAPNFPLAKNFSTARFHEGSPVVQQQGQIRTLTISVYSDTSDRKTLQLEGYIRASESTQEVELALSKLRLGLVFGGITALILSSISGVCLTYLALKPVNRSFQRLKQFTADASHELRNPLTAINTTVEVMQSHPEQLNPSDTKKLAILASATNQITRLVEDLLFLARSEAIAVPFKPEEPISLNEVLQDLVERFKPQAQSRKINFESRLLAGISVKGDTHQLSRLFSNLLVNAFQYTAAGGRVVLSLTKRGRYAVVYVKDTGGGIPPEHLPLIFQRFWRSDKARSQQREGLGLGLAIAQTIAQQHRGKITVSSQVGVGSCFQVHLPMV